MTLIDTLTQCIQHSIQQQWPAIADMIEVTLKRPPTETADWACHAAFKLAAQLKQPPRSIAEQILQPIQWPAEVQTCAVASPGFLNITLSPTAHWAVINTILVEKEQFGHQPARTEQTLLLEFVSANPTGPLHVGHARQAAIGDTLGRIFETQGWSVKREFYYNDQGNQIRQLTLSTQARTQGHYPGDPAFPAEGYLGEYVADIASAFLRRETIAVPHESYTITASGDPHQYEDVRRFAVAYLRQEQDKDIQAFGVHFDHYFLESSLYQTGAITNIIDAWQKNGFCYEQDGAHFLKTTCYGDDKDRVYQKSSGEYTYFTPDVAYHLNKFERGFSRVINIQGTDHHSTTIRVRAGLQALQKNIPTTFPEYVLHNMVKIVKDGVEMKVSKRAGTYVTLRDLLTLAGRDASRFFLIWRKTDTPFVFDVNLATQRTEDNPVYYIQYAHARICSVLSQAKSASTRTLSWDEHFVSQPIVISLLKKLADFPALLTSITSELAVHTLPHYLLELASAFHHFYNVERILTGQPEQEMIRIQFIQAIASVIKQGLQLMGVSAPDAM